MAIEQLSVFLENQPGKLVGALEVLADAQIDLRALSLADTDDFGILRIIVDKPAYASEILSDAGYLVKSNQVLAVAVNDRPGELAFVIRTLAEASINIEYTYAFVAHSHDKAYVMLRVDNNEAAAKVLIANGISMITADEVYDN